MTITINATKARQNFFDLLAVARDKKQITKVKLNGVVVAKIIPEEEKKFDWEKYEKEMKRGMKILRRSNWGDILEFREKKADVRRYKGW